MKINEVAIDDFIDFFCGDFISSGTFRDVYEYKQNPMLVIKVDRSNTFENIAENLTWCHVSHNKKVARWFAPIHGISATGRIILQERTQLYDPTKNWRIPDFFDDLQQCNFGLLGGKLVCHDYANTKLITKGYNNYKLIKPHWL